MWHTLFIEMNSFLGRLLCLESFSAVSTFWVVTPWEYFLIFYWSKRFKRAGAAEQGIVFRVFESSTEYAVGVLNKQGVFLDWNVLKRV